MSHVAEKLGVCRSPGTEGGGIDLYVRRGGYVVPFDRVAGAVRAKDRVGRVGQIGLGLIGGRIDHALGIMASRITGELQVQMTAPARVGSHLQRVILHLGCRHATHKLRSVSRHRRRLVLGTHACGI